MTSQPEGPFLLDVFQRECRITMGKISKYITYRGGEGQWSWLLHRITGIGVFLFLLTHILDTAMIGWGPRAYNDVMAVFRPPLFRVGEVVLAGAGSEQVELDETAAAAVALLALVAGPDVATLVLRDALEARGIFGAAFCAPATARRKRTPQKAILVTAV